MIVRVVMVIDRHETADRLRAFLEDLDVVVERLPVRAKRVPWPEIGQRAADLIIVSRSLLPSSPDSSFQALAGLPESPVYVVVSTADEPEDRTRLIAAGCEAVLNLDVSDEALADALKSLVERRSERQTAALPAEPSGSGPRLTDFASNSPAMAAFMDTVTRVASSNASLLLIAETGAGKEHLARAIHNESPRSEGPFIAVNCGAIPDALLESELFGHEEGSFTGATRSRKGWFEQAHSGTLFLDEVGELPLHLQVKLLRVLQFREVRRLGSERDVAIDVRIIAATNRDLVREVEEGRFRTDLYYRLSVVTLSIPSLRERPEDIPGLVEVLAADVARNLGRREVRVSPAALAALQAYSWPGNVRELANVLERAALLSRHDSVETEDLPVNISGLGSSRALRQLASDLPVTVSADLLARPLKEARQQIVDEFEAAYLTALLRETGGRIGATAHRAGIDPRSLYNKMKRFGLSKERFR